ncbi:hypothetical protein E4U54_000259, partial [Claviceps lovelessii]
MRGNVRALPVSQHTARLAHSIVSLNKLLKKKKKKNNSDNDESQSNLTKTTRNDETLFRQI